MDHHHIPHLGEPLYRPYHYPASFHELDLASDEECFGVVHDPLAHAHPIVDDVLFDHPYPYPHPDHFPVHLDDYHHLAGRFGGLHPTSSYERLGHVHHHPLYVHEHHLDDLTGLSSGPSLSQYEVPLNHLGHLDEFYPIHHFDGYEPVFANNYYRQMADVLPHHLPMFSDPYAFGYGAMGSGEMMGNYGLGPGIGLHDAMRDPFVYGIDHDYGYGHIPPLNTYGLTPSTFRPAYGPTLDDLYLFELMLRSDKLLSERERLARWENRLQWEELNELERANRWKEMELIQRSQLGLGPGSYWGYRLGSFPLDPTFGYTHPFSTMGYSGNLRRCAHPLAFSGPSHYPLSSSLAMRYPMWGVGGLGVGRRISGWYLKPKHILRQAEIRRDYAERRGEIPPRPLVNGPGLMGTGVPGMAPGFGYGLRHPARTRVPAMI